MKQQKEKTSWADFSRPLPRPFSLDAQDATLRGMEVLTDAKAAEGENIARSSRREAAERAKRASAALVDRMKKGYGARAFNPVAGLVQQ